MRSFQIVYRDQDGEFMCMRDDDDLLEARGASRDENRIEIWLE
jgi:hypothetical protein